MNSHSEDDLMVIKDLADLLVVLLAQPDADTAIDGMHKVAWVISNRAKAIRDREAVPSPLARVR